MDVDALQCRPIFFFHDDVDGLCSYLLLQRKSFESKGVVLKAHPRLTSDYVDKTKLFDKTIILDIAMVDDEFIRRARKPVVWIDHHEPSRVDVAEYINPRLGGVNKSVSEVCYDIVKEKIWLGMAGAVSDWIMPSFAGEFRKRYPGLCDVKKPGEANYETPLGKVIRIMSFNLKGASALVNRSIEAFTKIEEPDEILERRPSAEFVVRRFTRINEDFERLLRSAMAKKQGKLFVFKYAQDRLSLTRDLANELYYRFPDKVIVLGREKSGEVKCSLRGENILEKTAKALVGINATFGGHENAVGAVIPVHSFSRFLERLKEDL